MWDRAAAICEICGIFTAFSTSETCKCCEDKKMLEKVGVNQIVYISVYLSNLLCIIIYTYSMHVGKTSATHPRRLPQHLPLFLSFLFSLCYCLRGGSWRSLFGSHNSWQQKREIKLLTSNSLPTHTILQKTSVLPTSIVGGHCGMYQSRMEFGILIATSTIQSAKQAD